MLPDMALGGGQILVLRNILGFDPRFFESFVCVVWRDEETAMTDQYRAEGVTVVNLELKRSRLPFAIAKLVRYVRDNRIDLIQTNNTAWDRRIGVLAGRLCGVSVVNTFHSMYFPSPHGWRSIDRLLLRGGYERATTVSKAVREAWAREIADVGLSREQVDVVYPGLDLDRFGTGLSAQRKRALRSELGLSGSGPVLISVARLTRDKCLTQLVQMTERVRKRFDAQLLLVGEGSEREAIEEAVRSHGLESAVHLAGRRDDVPDLLAISDLFVFASRGEGLGLVAIEAMASRVPVVAYELPALTEVVTHSVDGVLVPLEDPEAMAQAVIELLDDDEARGRMGERARHAMRERFSRQESARALEDVYLKALGRARPSSQE
jgi:glycosyltransferase involved in cell wall biosynthesis